MTAYSAPGLLVPDSLAARCCQPKPIRSGSPRFHSPGDPP